MNAANLSILSSALSDNPRQVPRLARQAGFAGLLFDAFSPSFSIPDLSISGRREFRRMIDADQCQLVGLRLDLDARGLGPGADVDRLLARIGQVMEAAVGLGSRLVCMDLGPLPVPPSRPTPRSAIAPDEAGLILIPTLAAAPAPQTTSQPISAQIDPNVAAQVDAALVEIGRRADRFGVTVAFRSELAGFAAIERAITAANCPCFGLDCDPVAILRDEWSIDEVFSRLGPLIRHVRARDAVRGADRRTKPAIIGQGSVDWADLLSHLDETGYHGWITLDPLELPARAAAAATGRAHLLGLRP